MTSEKEVQVLRAPAGKFIVVVWDDFPFPPEPCRLAETDALDTAIEFAKRHVAPFTSPCIYDHAGKLVFDASNTGDEN